MKHTPGPWQTTPFNSVVGCVITAQPDKTKNTFNIGSIHGGQTKDEVKANAKLIAAAPTMLKALQGFIHHDNALKDEFKASPSLRWEIEEAIKLATE